MTGPADVATDLADNADVPLEQLADDDAEETLRRVAPTDGTRLLVAASFNSAI
jgi:hypothetical protein